MYKYLSLFLVLIACSPLLLFGKKYDSEKIDSEQEFFIEAAITESKQSCAIGPKILYERIDIFPTDPEYSKGMCCYLLSFENLTLIPDQFFDFYSFTSISRPMKTGTFYVDNDLKIFVRNYGEKSDGYFEEFNLVLGRETIPGEIFYFVLISADKKMRTATSVTPRPLESHGESGQTITMDLNSIDGSYFFLHGEKFKPNEKLVLTSISEDEKLVKDLTADENGWFGVRLLLGAEII